MEHFHLLAQKDYQPGDVALSGYLAWHEWAEAQYKAGLSQCPCGRCGKWKFPEELSSLINRNTLQSRQGPVERVTTVCLSCAKV
jgi:hypothetical protein